MVPVVLVMLMLLVIALAVALGRLLVERSGAHAPASRSAEQAVALAVQTLREERQADLSRTVETVLAVAGDKLGTQLSAGQQQLDSRNELIARQLDGMTGELRRVNDVVLALQRERAEQHGQLLSGLHETIRQTQSVVTTTQSLREALSSSKARGQWGERMADDVLRLAGFVEGINYRRQTAIAGGTVPDFTFFLPGGHVLHMDVKFPIDNYLRHLQAASEAERRAAAQQFSRDVRERIRSLTGRGYVQSGVTLDFVLLFIPNEATYGFIHENDPEAADLALRQKVVLCSPFTLFAVLGLVRQAVDSLALQRSTDQILDILGGFTTQWEKFSDAIETVGRRLDSTAKAYEDLSGTRRRQLQRMVDQVDQLRRQTAVDEGAGGGRPPAADEGPALAQPVPLPRPERPEEGDVRHLARRLTG
ncbi:MAG: recombination protein RmuC [Acidimicrobiia bacterium]|jgi:DNA recombination protein RmuC|nr:recombination protein RmuC [Acidimicrobiia bacterium]